MFHFYPHPIKIFNINFLLAHFERWIKSQKGQNFFELLLRKNHNPPLQNVLYLVEWGWGLWLSQFQICPYPPPPSPPGHLHCFKTFGQIPHPPATLQKLSHSSNPLNILLNAAEMSEVLESCLTDVFFFYFKKIVYSRKPTLNGLFQRLSNASTKQWI